MIGPQCSSVCSSVGRLAAHINIPVFTGLCQGIEMSNKDQFKVCIFQEHLKDTFMCLYLIF